MSRLGAALAVLLSASAGATPALAGAAPAPEVELPAAEVEPPAPGEPTPRGRLSLIVGGGWEVARLEGVDASGPAGTLGLQVATGAPTDGLRLRVAWQLTGRRGETPKGLAVTEARVATLVGLEHGRFALVAGGELASVRVARAGPGAMVGVDLGLRVAASADLLRFEQGAVFAEVSGALAGPTREEAVTFNLGWRAELR